MLKKFLFTFGLLIGFHLLLTGRAYAAVDILLEDDPEEGVVSVSVNSNESYVAGLDFGIIYSGGVRIMEVALSQDYCNMMGNTYYDESRIDVECFNDADVEMEGVLLTVSYIAETDDYFFYLDEALIDLGPLTLGEVENINRPEDVVFETEITEVVQEEEGEEEANKIVAFLSENSLYVLGGVFSILLLVVIIIGLTSKEEITEEKQQ